MVCVEQSHGKRSAVKEAVGKNWDLGSSTLGESLLTSLCLFLYLYDGTIQFLSYQISQGYHEKEVRANKRGNYCELSP